jgi:hypothetical protein
MKLYTKEQLLKKYRGKYVDVYPHYDYMTRVSRTKFTRTTTHLKKQ